MFKKHTKQGEVDFIQLETDENRTTNLVDVNIFEALFGDVERNPSYEALSGSHTFKFEDTFSTSKVEKIIADPQQDNYGSIRILEKLGMKKVGYIEKVIAWELSKQSS